MQIARDVFLEILKDAYSAYYTLRTDVACEFPLAFRADYAARDARCENLYGSLFEYTLGGQISNTHMTANYLAVLMTR